MRAMASKMRESEEHTTGKELSFFDSSFLEKLISFPKVNFLFHIHPFIVIDAMKPSCKEKRQA